MKKILYSIPALLCTALALPGQILQTDFSGSTGNRSLPFVDASDTTNNGNRTVTRNGFTWTVGNAAVLDLASLDSLTMGAYTWGSAATPIQNGNLFLTLNGGAYNTGTGGTGTNSSMRMGGTTYQFNSGAVGTGTSAAPADVATYNLLIEVTGASLSNLSASFTLGTANTSGVFDNNSAPQNGLFNVRISPVVAGVVDFANGFYFYNSAQAVGAGAGPLVQAAADPSITLSSGIFLFQIEHSGKTSGQRSSIGELTIIPEPSTYALIGGVFALGLVMLRRRRKA